MAENYTTIAGRPVFRATLKEDADGMKKISLVTAPAVCSDFQAFKALEDGAAPEASAPLRFEVQDDERQIVRGVVMRANCPIIRKSERLGIYFIYYDAETIRAMAEQYLGDGLQNAVNLQHKDGTDTDAVHLVQFFIKDTAAGVNPAGFEDIEDGSLFAEFHVTDANIWAGVKDGTFKGFSLEGYFTLEPSQEVVSTEKAAFSTHKNDMNTLMERLKTGIASVFAAEEAAAEIENEQKFGSVATDKGVLAWDGDEPLKEGDAVRIVAEDGSESEAADGVYTSESHVITVADGKVSDIDEIEPAADEAEPETAAEEKASEVEASAFARIMAKLEASFEERYAAIYDAIYKKGIDAYIVEAGDTYAVVELYDGEGRHFERYDLTFREDGSVELGDSIEVYPTFITAEERDALDARKSEAEAAQVAAAEELAAVKAELEALKASPAGAPAHEAFQGFEGAKPTTADDRRNNVKAILG